MVDHARAAMMWKRGGLRGVVLWGSAAGVAMAVLLGGCVEEKVVRSKTYSRQQFGGKQAPLKSVAPEKKKSSKFDPIGEMGRAVSKPFKKDAYQKVTWGNRQIIVPRNMTGTMPVKGADGKIYNLEFEKGQLKSSKPKDAGSGGGTAKTPTAATPEKPIQAQPVKPRTAASGD